MCGVSEQSTSCLPLNSSLIANALMPWEPTAISAVTRPTSSPPPMCSPPSTQPALAPIHPHHPKARLHPNPSSTAPSATTTVPPSPSRCPSSTPPPASCAVAGVPTPPTVTTSPSAPRRPPNLTEYRVRDFSDRFLPLPSEKELAALQEKAGENADDNTDNNTEKAADKSSHFRGSPF